MKLDAREIQEHADALGFRADSLEKVFRLMSLLEALRSHAFLRPRVALKGDTALNLFLFDVPRLSVDIDLNYVGSGDREVMLADRPKLERAIQAVCEREALTVKRVPSEHAGGKLRLAFTSTAGTAGRLDVDLNFILRTPLWPVTTVDSKQLGPAIARQIPVIDPHELAAGKLAALCSRNASRDLFDVRELLRRDDLEGGKLRLGFVVYGGINRKDWRSVCIEDVDADASEVERALVPMLPAAEQPAKLDIAAWTENLVRETRELMSRVLPLEDREGEFLERLNGAGEIAPDLLTGDGDLQTIIRDHPGLKWKALNVKKRLGLA